MLQQFDERNRDIKIGINGKQVPREAAGVSPFDSVVQGGDAVWEGLRLYDGKIFKLYEHLNRLRGSAKALAFATIPSDDELVEHIRATLMANGMHDGVHVRLTLTRGVKITSGMDPRLNQSGPTVIVLAEFKSPVYDTSGLSLVTSSVRRFPPDCLDPKIHHNNLIQSILAKVEANVAGADDALMLDTRGFVAETNATHIFAVSGGRLVTSRAVACPEGITRATVLDLAARHSRTCDVRDISLTELYRADEVFCTGTMGEVAGVVEIDGRAIGLGNVGAVTREVASWYRDEVRTSGDKIV